MGSFPGILVLVPLPPTFGLSGSVSTAEGGSSREVSVGP